MEQYDGSSTLMISKLKVYMKVKYALSAWSIIHFKILFSSPFLSIILKVVCFFFFFYVKSLRKSEIFEN